MAKRATDLKVKHESLPTRCEVCHQADLFDAALNYCRRCTAAGAATAPLIIAPAEKITARLAPPPPQYSVKLQYGLYLVTNLFILLVGYNVYSRFIDMSWTRFGQPILIIAFVILSLLFPIQQRAASNGMRAWNFYLSFLAILIVYGCYLMMTLPTGGHGYLFITLMIGHLFCMPWLAVLLAVNLPLAGIFFGSGRRPANFPPVTSRSV